MSQAVSTSGSLLSVIVNPGSGSPAECGVTYIESLDLANPAVLRELDSGSYVLYGKFKAYSGDDTIIVFESKLNANIVKSTDCSSIMIFNPVNSKVECLTIYDDRYERTDVALQDVVAHIGQLKNDLTKLLKKSDNFELFSLEAYTGYSKELRKSQAGHTYIAIFTKYSGIVSIRNLVNGSWKEMSPVMTVDTCLCELTVTADGSIRVNAGNLEYTGDVYFFDVTGDPELQSYLEINGISGVDKVVSGIIPDIESEIEEINKKFVQLTGDNKCVCCWGDSLTEGAHVYGERSYPAKLAKLLGSEYTVMRYGVGGETPRAILARMGAYATYAEPFTMPASGSVDLDLKTVGLPIGWRYKGGLDKGINPVIIEGVEGTIVTTEPTSGNWVYTFTRTEAGESKTFDRPVFVSTHASRNNRYDISIIFIGQNKDYTSDEELCDEIQCAIDYLKNNRYIVVSMHSEKQTESLTRKERLKFGEHFLYTKEYLSKYGLLDAGIEPTEEDIQAMSEGAVPPSLMSDGCHFTSAGYTIIANLVYEKGKELGYW